MTADDDRGAGPPNERPGPPPQGDPADSSDSHPATRTPHRVAQGGDEAPAAAPGEPPTSPAGNAAHRAGLCVEGCGRRYSPGRPRCNECHNAWVARQQPPPTPPPSGGSKSVQRVAQISGGDGLTFQQRVRARQEREARQAGAGQKPPHTAHTDAWIAAPGHNPAYVAKAVQAELERLAAATEGVRNATLHAAACNVFEFVKGGHVDAGKAVAELERIATEIGLESREIQATLRSAWNRVTPRTIPAPRGTDAYTIESTPK